MTYEVFYQTGGHSGPHTYESARDLVGKLLLTDTCALIAARDARGVSGYLPLSLYCKVLNPYVHASGEGQVMVTGWERLSPHQVPAVYKWMRRKKVANLVQIGGGAA